MKLNYNSAKIFHTYLVGNSGVLLNLLEYIPRLLMLVVQKGRPSFWMPLLN